VEEAHQMRAAVVVDQKQQGQTVRIPQEGQVVTDIQREILSMIGWEKGLQRLQQQEQVPPMLVAAVEVVRLLGERLVLEVLAAAGLEAKAMGQLILPLALPIQVVAVAVAVRRHRMVPMVAPV